MQMFNRFYNPGGLTPGSCSQMQHLQGCTPVYNAGQWWCSCLAAPPPSPQQRVRRRVRKTPKTWTYMIGQMLSMEPAPTKLSSRKLTSARRSLTNPCGCGR